jgi:hypothetical protein
VGNPVGIFHHVLLLSIAIVIRRAKMCPATGL